VGSTEMMIAGTDLTPGGRGGEESRNASRTTSDQPPSHDKSRREHQEALLDESLEDTFPASDPPAVLQPTYVKGADD